jgi:hypothetical protein
LAAEIRSAQVVGRRGSEGGKVVVSGGELSVSLGRDRVAGVELSVADDAGRESGNRGAGTHADAARNLTWAAIGDGGSAEDGKIFCRAQGLGSGLSRESCQRG